MTDAKGRPVPRSYEKSYAKRIPVSEIRKGNAYLIHARNGRVGMAVNENGHLGYMIRREKFGDVYLFVEYDFDGDFFPTAIPLKDLGPAPVPLTVEWLAEQESKISPEEDPWSSTTTYIPSPPR